MGEAKRKRRGPCRCGSGKPAETCCLGNRGWHKDAATISLTDTGESGTHDRCYLNVTNACCDKISKEHYVSEVVLRVLAEKEVEVSGMPFLAKGEKRKFTFSNLQTKCLCETHNNALSNVDAAGGRFFAAVQTCATVDEGPSQHFLLSGHDIERWCLRTLLAMSAGKNLVSGGERLTGIFHPTIDIVQLLQHSESWSAPQGLYFTQKMNVNFTRTDTFALGPLLLRGTSDMVGLIADIQGLNVALIAAQHPIAGTGLENAHYRPGRFIFRLKRVAHTIQLSWNDAHPHIDIIVSWSE